MPLFGRGRKGHGEPVVPSEAADSGSIDPELAAVQIGRQLLRSARKHRAGLLSSRFWSDQLMNWAMKDPDFKVQLFRFVDVFPMLRGPEMVYDYLVDYLSRPGVTLPPGMELGLKAGRMAKGALTRTITGRIEGLAGNFIAGTDAASAIRRLKKLWEEGVAFSVDLLGEACVSDEEARAYQRRYLDLIETLPELTRDWPASAKLESDHVGPVPRANVSIKISSLSARTDPIDFQGTIDRLLEVLRPILEAAAGRGVLVNFDMEQYALKDLTIALFERCCEEFDFPARCCR